MNKMISYIHFGLLICCLLIFTRLPTEAKKFNHQNYPVDYHLLEDEADPTKEQQYRICIASCKNVSSPSCGSGAHSNLRRNLRIFGGRDAKPGEFPYSVRLKIDLGPRSGNATCGGVIIDAHHILSAAHCFQSCFGREREIGPDNVMVAIGEHSTKIKGDGEKILTVSRLTVHPNFGMCKWPPTPNDLAILRTSQRMDMKLSWDGYGSVNAVCMPQASSKRHLESGQEAIITGWGWTKIQSLASVLQVARVELADMKQCRKVWKGAVSVDERLHVCAHKPGGRESSCRGDSGGALVVVNEDGKLELAGITSLGRGSCDNKKPVVYTRVSEFLDWIEAQRKWEA